MTRSELARNQRLLEKYNPGDPVKGLHRTSKVAGTGGVTNYTSYNWSGYAALPAKAGFQFSYIFSRWTVPSVNCNRTPGTGVPPATVVEWNGLDGWGSGPVEQAGTETICEGTSPVYTAWWEMFPTNDITAIDIAVSPGDAIASSVRWTPGTTDYTIGLTGHDHWCVVLDGSGVWRGLTCAKASAEAIVEAPTYGTITPLADYEWTIFEANEVKNKSLQAGGFTNANWQMSVDRLTRITEGRDPAWAAERAPRVGLSHP